MKFEEFLIQPREGQRRRLALEEEVEELQERLDGELRLNNVLRWAMKGPVLSCQWISPELPFEVQVLLTELAMVEEEIIWLERKVRKLNLSLSQEKKLTTEWEMRLPNKHEMKQLVCTVQENGAQERAYGLELNLASPRSHGTVSKYETIEERRRSCKSSASDVQSFSSTRFNEEMVDRSWRNIQSSQSSSDKDIGFEKPNRISEELLRSLIGMFTKISKASELESEGASSASKNALSCIKSRGFTTKTTFACKARSSFNHENIQTVDPYTVSPDPDAISRDAAAYKGFTQITRSSLSKGYSSGCKAMMRTIRVLLEKLCNVDLTFLTYKQKLAFWINIYNACIMNAYLQHGLPSTQERMLSLMNKAALNVGGIVLNALAIEHYILRHPHDTKYDPADEKEMLLRHAYGLRYPEPNVTFALCRGNWSSPALKVYTPDEVVNELERAKIEYLEASVGVRSKKKILVPKLLQWHMQDFADDLESLIEWIYSQLPQNGLLKRRIMECLNEESNPIRNMVEIVPYEYEFRYLIPPLGKGYT